MILSRSTTKPSLVTRHHVLLVVRERMQIAEGLAEHLERAHPRPAGPAATCRRATACDAQGARWTTCFPRQRGETMTGDGRGS